MVNFSVLATIIRSITTQHQGNIYNTFQNHRSHTANKNTWRENGAKITDKCVTRQTFRLSVAESPNHPPLRCSSVGLEPEKEALLRAAELWKVVFWNLLFQGQKIPIKVGEEQGEYNSQNIMIVLISVLHIDSTRKLTAIIERSGCGYITLSKCAFIRGFCLCHEVKAEG